MDEVQVVRNLPGEIDLQIVERKPIAWVTAEKEMSDPFGPDAAYLVDARGILMKEKKLLPEYLGLPVIAGCTTEGLEAGKRIESYEGKAALELLRLSTRSFMQMRFQIREIDLSKGFCMLVTDKNRTRVIFGFKEIDEQLQRLEKYLVWADDAKREIETLNLMVKTNVPVTFAKLASEIINDTLSRDGEEPKILKATPANPGQAPKQKNPETTIRKAVPVERERKTKGNG